MPDIAALPRVVLLSRSAAYVSRAAAQVCPSPPYVRSTSVIGQHACPSPPGGTGLEPPAGAIHGHGQYPGNLCWPAPTVNRCGGQG
jgi:hypothetical protein